MRVLIYGAVVAVGAAVCSGCKAEPAAVSGSPEEAFLAEIRGTLEEEPEAQPAADALLPGEAALGLIPVIELETQQLDMGVISNKGSTTKEVRIYNKGTAPLKILRVKTACGCTVGEPEDKTILPGRDTVMDVTVDPFKFLDFGLEKTLWVVSNDPKNKELPLQVLAEIEPEFSLTSREVDFNEVRKGTPAERTVVLRQLGDEPVEVTGFQVRGEPVGLDLSYDRQPEEQWTLPDKPEYAITARLTPEAPTGRYRAYFDILTTCKRVPRFLVEVSANIEAFYEIDPKSLMFRIADPGQRDVASLTVHAERPFDIADLNLSSEDLEITSTRADTPNGIRFDLHVKPDAAPGRKSAQLTFTIKTEEDAISEKIRVYGYVRQQKG